MLVKKLQSLGAVPILMDDTKKARLISLLESRVRKLPKTYLDMIQYFVGDIEFDKLICYEPITPSPWTSKDGTDMVVQLYGLVSKYKSGSIFDVLDTYQARLPMNWTPVGAAPGGNLICISTSSKNFGEIGFWDHEKEVFSGQAPQPSIFLAAHSFKEFVDSLREDSSPPRKSGLTGINLKF